MSVVSTAVYSLATWSRDSCHSSSPGFFLLTAAQKSKLRKCSKIISDLSAERHEEGNVASRLSYSKYIVLSNHYFLTVSHGRVKLGLLVIVPSISLRVVGMYSLLSPFLINRYVMRTTKC